jgi:hypothetical protein
MKIGEGEAVLEAMGGEQGGDAVDVAQAEDEADDGLRGDRVEPRGGRVVENDGGMGDEGTSDSDTTTHTAGEFGRKHVAGVAEFDEAEDFVHAGSDFVFVNAIFVKAVGDIFADGEGVEQCAFLEDETDLAARREQFGLGQAGDVLAENTDAAGIGAKESGSKLEQKSLTGAGLAEKDYGFAFLSGEGDTAKNFTFLKAKADIGEFDGSVADCGESCRQAAGGEIHERSEKLIGEVESDFREKSVGNDDEDGRDDDSLGGGPADALRAATDIQTLVAADGGEDESENNRFHKALHDIGEFENFDGPFPEGGGIDAQGENAGDHAAKEPDKDGNGGEKRKGDQGGEDAGSDEFAAGVGAHGAHGVDLLGDEHGAEFGGDARGAAAGDQKTGDRGAEFANEGEADDVSGEGGLAEAYELGARLEDHDRANEKPGKEDDGERANADVVHLLKGVLNVAGAASEIGDGVVGENGVVLDFEDASFGKVLKDLHDGGDFRSAGFRGSRLNWSVSHEFLWVCFEESVTGEGASVKAKSGVGIVKVELSRKDGSLHALFEGKKQFHATRGVPGEFVSSKRSVQEIGESGSSHNGITRHVSECHGPIGKEALLRCFAEEHVRVFVPRVLSDHADEFQHGFLLALEDLQEGATLVEKHARNTMPGTGSACFFQYGLKLRLGEEMNGSACANYMKHPTLDWS